MHASSMENMRRCVDWYLPAGRVRAIDLGAMDVNGSYRELMPERVAYTGVDLAPGRGVDVVLEDVYRLPFGDGSVDVVLSGQMLEHCAHFWRVFSEIHRVLSPGGVAFVIAPSSGPVHRYPVDCYRFYPDAFQALADWADLRLVHSWTDERGPWRDLVGVFQKGGSLQARSQPERAVMAVNSWQAPHAEPEVERRAGARPYLDVLRDLHQLVEPAVYLEIGVRKGSSLALARGRCVAIDPDPHPDFVVADGRVDFHRCTSDDFFFFGRQAGITGTVDLAFIDGMHLAEYVYRDFMNVEATMRPGGVIVIDDVLPNHPVQARRERQSQVWTGDVWRFAELLAERRPDLRLTWLDTAPSGLLVVSRVDPRSRRLAADYNKAIRRLEDSESIDVPAGLLERERAVAPTLANLRQAIDR